MGFNPFDPGDLFSGGGGGDPLGLMGGGSESSSGGQGGGTAIIGGLGDDPLKDKTEEFDPKKAYGFQPTSTDSDFNLMRKKQFGMGGQGG